jgi:hypothetical protein
MGRVLSYFSELGIRLFDKIGFEVHFIRLLYFTVFDVDLHERHHYPSLFASSDLSLALDLLFLLGIILPLFFLSVRYLTSSVIRGPYESKWNALLAPLGVVPLFFFRDWDICFMSVLVCTLNMWVAWKQLDGSAEEDAYTWSQYYREQA